MTRIDLEKKVMEKRSDVSFWTRKVAANDSRYHRNCLHWAQYFLSMYSGQLEKIKE